MRYSRRPPTPGRAAPSASVGSPAVKWTITIVVLFFVLEYLLLPEIASARKSLNLLGEVNIFVADPRRRCSSSVALAAYAELTHTVLSPGAPHRFRLFRVNMSSLAVSHVLPGGTAPGTAVAYRLLDRAEVPGSTAAFGLATQGVGSAVVLNGIFWFALLISIPLSGYNPLYGFAAIAGVILLGLFAGTVLLLTRGKHTGRRATCTALAGAPAVRQPRPVARAGPEARRPAAASCCATAPC